MIATPEGAKNSPHVEAQTGRNDRPGAVIIGGDYQGLGIARSLGRHGIPICIIDDELSIARYSRYTAHHVRVTELRDEEKTAGQILEIGRRLNLRGWVLFPTREETVAALSRHKDRLGEYFRVPTPAWDIVRWAWDKRNTYALADSLGIPTPKTHHIRSIDELEETNFQFPVAIKPAIKEHFIYATRVKAWRADTREQLASYYRKAADQIGGAEVIVQDLIPGDGSNQFAYCAFFKDGKSIGSMTVQRARQHPPEFGRASTYVSTIDMPEVAILSVRFLRAIDYYGLVELEYKRDSRDGSLKLLDVNARTWGYHSIGAAAGVDFPYLLFRDQLGQGTDPLSAKPGVNWVRAATDVPTSLLEMARGHMAVGDYLRSMAKVHTESVFCLDDPIPGVAELGLIPYLFFKRGF